MGRGEAESKGKGRLSGPAPPRREVVTTPGHPPPTRLQSCGPLLQTAPASCGPTAIGSPYSTANALTSFPGPQPRRSPAGVGSCDYSLSLRKAARCVLPDSAPPQTAEPVQCERGGPLPEVSGKHPEVTLAWLK